MARKETTDVVQHFVLRARRQFGQVEAQRGLRAGGGGSLKTIVRILRGQYRGREGWISGTLAEREKSGIGKALVKGLPGPPEFYALSSLAEVQQLSLFETQKDPPPAQRPAADSES